MRLCKREQFTHVLLWDAIDGTAPVDGLDKVAKRMRAIGTGPSAVVPKTLASVTPQRPHLADAHGGRCLT
jgi:hypothetical protein